MLAQKPRAKRKGVSAGVWSRQLRSKCNLVRLKVGDKGLPLASTVSERPHWRFEDLDIWQLAAELAVKFHRLAAKLDEARFYRYADQLRGAGLSLSNNIAEGSGSHHTKEFVQ